jgi:hypothetical protein
VIASTAESAASSAGDGLFYIARSVLTRCPIRLHSMQVRRAAKGSQITVSFSNECQEQAVFERVSRCFDRTAKAVWMGSCGVGQEDSRRDGSICSTMLVQVSISSFRLLQCAVPSPRFRHNCRVPRFNQQRLASNRTSCSAMLRDDRDQDRSCFHSSVGNGPKLWGAVIKYSVV